MSTGRLGAGDTAIQPTIFDAKGDLLTATAADTPARIAVGSDGQYLKADSAAGTGLAWATLPASGKVLQVVAATYTTEVVVSNDTETDTGLTATISPSATSSKILVLVQQNGTRKTSGNLLNRIQINLKRGTTTLSTSYDGLYTGTAIDNTGFQGFCYLDSPNTTSATTYKTTFFNQFNGAAVRVQTTNSGSSIVLLEIGA